MKTSNIIITSFLIFLFGGIILLYIGSKYYKTNDDPSNFISEEKKISSFSVVVAEPGAIFNLITEKENKIKQTYLKGTVPNISSYTVRNDTLFIFSKKPKPGKVKHALNVTEVFCINVKSIVTKENSNVRLLGLQADTLNITMKKSHLEGREFNKVAFLFVEGQNSDIYLNGKKMDKIEVKLDKTLLNINSKENIKSISGNLKNTSTLDCSSSLKVNLESDKSSKIYLAN